MKWLVLILIFFSATAAADSEAEFWLCSSYVFETDVGEKADGWPVFVKLSEQGTASFSKFSKTNFGKMIRIVVDGRQFARFTIQDEGGKTLHAEFSNKADAQAWQRILVEELPVTPCGAYEEQPGNQHATPNCGVETKPCQTRPGSY